MIAVLLLTAAGAVAIHAAWRRPSPSGSRWSRLRLTGWCLLLTGFALALLQHDPVVGFVRWLMIWQFAALATPVASADWRRDNVLTVPPPIHPHDPSE